MSWKSILTWDGILPAAVVGIPAVACSIFGKNHLFTLLTTFMLPVIASLFRASAGPGHLRLAGPPWLIRKLIFAAAVVLLFVLELISNVGQVSNPLPVGLQICLLAAYLIYFGMIVLTFRRFPLSLLRISLDD